MRKLAKRLQHAIKRRRAAQRRARNERKRTRHAQANLEHLHGEFNKLHERLLEHPDSEGLQKQLADVIAAIERTASRRARRGHRLHVWRQRVKFRTKRETTLRRKYKAAKAQWDKEHQGDFETWMLNGHSGNVDDDLKPVIAFLVAVRGQTITDTYDYWGHTPSSLHYPRNDPTSPQQGRAVDSAGPDMGGAMDACYAHFGAGKFLELFGPRTYYVKNGGRYSVYPYFPGHGDHQHSGVA